MRGLVLGFDSALGTGLLRGDDGKRYVFAIDDWLARPRPRPGQLVDFELHKGMALEIFIIKNAGFLDGLALMETFSTLSRQVSRASKKYAFSVKLLMPLVLILLFAMPFTARGAMEFSGFNTVGYVRDMLEDTGTLSAIGSAETRAVMEAGRNALYLYLLAYILPLMAGYKLMRGLQGHKRAKDLLPLSLTTIAVIALLPVLAVGWFHLFAPAGNLSLKQSVLTNLSLDLPAAYLNYGWGAVLMLGVGVLGLLNSLRKRGLGSRKTAEGDAAHAPGARRVLRPRRRRPVAAQSVATAHPQPVAVQMPAPQAPMAQQNQPQSRPQPQPQAPQPQQRPAQPRAPQRQPEQQPQQVAPAAQRAEPPQPEAIRPAPAQPVPVQPAPAPREAAEADQGVFFDDRAEEDGDDISELLRRIRQEEGEV